jgi:hypothetical protein
VFESSQDFVQETQFEHNLNTIQLKHFNSFVDAYK